MCVCVCVVCVCLCVCVGEEEEGSGGGGGCVCCVCRSLDAVKGANLTADSLRSVPQDHWSSTASSGKANDWKTGNVLFSTYSQTDIV